MLASQPFSGANLRRLHIYKMVESFCEGDAHLSTASLSAFIHLFVKQCPQLESLCLTHGQKYLSRHEVLPPLPSLGHAFTNVTLPRTLVMLRTQGGPNSSCLQAHLPG